MEIKPMAMIISDGDVLERLQAYQKNTGAVIAIWLEFLVIIFLADL